MLPASRLVDLFALVGVHAQDAADALALAARRVEHHRAARDLARVDAEERQVAVRVVDDLEGERREGLVVGRLARSTILSFLFGVDALDRRDVERRRQVVHDRVEQHLHALVLERRAAEHRDELEARCVPLRSAAIDLVVGDFVGVAVEELRHDLVVDVGARLDQLLAPLAARLGFDVGGDLDPVVLLALRLLVEDGGLHRDEIDDALVLVFFADRPLDRHRVRRRGAPSSMFDAHLEVGADLVHLVDERDARDVVLVGLAPDRLALRLDAVAAVEHRDRAVEDAQASARPRW